MSELFMVDYDLFSVYIEIFTVSVFYRISVLFLPTKWRAEKSKFIQIEEVKHKNSVEEPYLQSFTQSFN